MAGLSYVLPYSEFIDGKNITLSKMVLYIKQYELSAKMTLHTRKVSNILELIARLGGTFNIIMFPFKYFAKKYRF